MTDKTGIIPRKPPEPKTPLSEQERAEVILTLKTLSEVVAEAGDEFVYTMRVVNPDADADFVAVAQCVYVYGGEPDCLGAKVLHRLGMSLEDLARWEGRLVAEMSPDAALPAYLREMPEAPIGKHALFVLGEAQEKQDAGRNWGDARDAALYYAYTEYGVKIHV